MKDCQSLSLPKLISFWRNFSIFISRRLCIIAGILFLTLIHINLAPADVLKGTWATVAPAPTQRTEVAAAAVEGKIYVAGGFNKPNLQNALKFAISNEVEMYDTASDS